MKTLTTATIKKRLDKLSKENREFMTSQNTQVSILQDKCPHEEEDYHQNGGFGYHETGTVYCAVCKKKLYDVDCSPTAWAQRELDARQTKQVSRE